MGRNDLETIKFIVFNFLIEQGYDESADTFYRESRMEESEELYGDDSCPRGALINLMIHSNKLQNYTENGDEDPEENQLIRQARFLNPSDGFPRLRDVEEARKKEPFFKPSSEFPKNAILAANGHLTEGVSCAWHPTEDCILSTSGGYISDQESTVRTWNLNPQAENWTNTEQILEDSYFFTQKNFFPVRCAAWNAKTGDVFAMGTESGGIGLFHRDFSTISNTTIDGTVKEVIWAPKTSEGPDYLACMIFESKVVIFDCTDRLNGLKKPVKIFSDVYTKELHFLSPDTGKFVVNAGDLRHKLYLYSIDSDQPVRRFFGHRWVINSHSTAPKYNLISSCSNDLTVKIWAPDDSVAKRTHRLTGAALFSRWSPNAETLLAQSGDYVLYHFDIPTGKLLKKLLCCPGTDAKFSNNGTMFAVGCDEGMVYVWDSRSYEMVRVQKRDDDHTSLVELDWSHDDKKIAGMYKDGELRLFDMRV